jgi:hypothetical protein
VASRVRPNRAPDPSVGAERDQRHERREARGAILDDLAHSRRRAQLHDEDRHGREDADHVHELYRHTILLLGDFGTVEGERGYTGVRWSEWCLEAVKD